MIEQLTLSLCQYKSDGKIKILFSLQHANGIEDINSISKSIIVFNVCNVCTKMIFLG